MQRFIHFGLINKVGEETHGTVWANLTVKNRSLSNGWLKVAKSQGLNWHE